METWEVVLILVLLTISISVIANREVPLSLITLLDNTYFQLIILAATLGVAVVSPPVAIVAISTIVTIYYIRNVVKVQIMQMRRRFEMEQEAEIERREAEKKVEEDEESSEPRIEIKETTQTTTQIEIVANKDTLEAALSDHESRQPAKSKEQIGTRSNLGGVPPSSDYAEVPQKELPDPRKTQDSNGVESFDSRSDVNSAAPVGTSRKILGTVDSDVFSASRRTPIGYNESSASKKIRAFNENTGQYDIDESRPVSEVERYVIADYSPADNMGSNQFELLGDSIDDKINILSAGVLPSAMPPSNYNEAYPSKSR